MSTAPEYLTTKEAAKIARKHPVTIRKALEAGKLHGTQQTAGGRWAIRQDCLEAFIERRPCAHREKAKHQGANVSPIRGRAA